MSEPANILSPVPPGRVVRIWRIEHPKDGIGPFFDYGRPAGIKGLRTSYQGDWIHPVNMPGPNQDKRLRGRAACGIYAFPTARELLRWFSGWALMQLTALGYVVRLYAVPFGEHERFVTQVCFYRDAAVLLHEIAPAAVMWCAAGPTETPRRWNTCSMDW